jgi:hypothetical protein
MIAASFGPNTATPLQTPARLQRSPRSRPACTTPTSASSSTRVHPSLSVQTRQSHSDGNHSQSPDTSSPGSHSLPPSSQRTSRRPQGKASEQASGQQPSPSDQKQGQPSCVEGMPRVPTIWLALSAYSEDEKQRECQLSDKVLLGCLDGFTPTESHGGKELLMVRSLCKTITINDDDVHCTVQRLLCRCRCRCRLSIHSHIRNMDIDNSSPLECNMRVNRDLCYTMFRK